MKQIVGIAGRETGYWIKLMEYMNSQGHFETFVCTQEESMKDELEKRKPSILFREQGFAEDVVFQGQEVMFVTDKTSREGIYQYQPADLIYEEMLRCMSMEEVLAEPREQSRKSICAVYSPLGRSGKTSFALAYAKEFSFFYIGMEDYGLPGESEHNMSEVLYHIRTHKERMAQTVMELSESWQGIQMLSSPIIFQDIKQLSIEDYEWFFQQLREEETFPSVIIDLGTGCLPDFEIFSLFDKVYVPVLNEQRAREKMRIFWNLIFEIYGAIDNRYRVVKVPDRDWQEDGFLERIEEKSYQEEYSLNYDYNP